ncbi:MAG: hypothetical protein ACI85O_001993, partial [Saprospiraceae bacterium]
AEFWGGGFGAGDSGGFGDLRAFFSKLSNNIFRLEEKAVLSH